MSFFTDMTHKNKRILISIGSVFLVGLVIIIIQFSMIFAGRYGSVAFTIYENGGTFEISSGRNLINGFRISVPREAYTTSAELVISTEKPTDFILDYDLDPISPLIHLDMNDRYSNVPAYSEVPMTIKIPIDIDSSTEFAMVFYVNTFSGFIEAIPVYELTDSEITIKVQHLGSFIVSKRSYQELDASTVDNSGYTPGEDDWPFANYGSILAPNGHCAGQTLTSAYYYVNHKQWGEESLWTRFNNDTPDFWFDDSDAYRYASVIQDSIDFTSTSFLNSIDSSIESQKLTYYSFKYAIQITGNPQFLALYSINGTTVESGHAMLVYKVENDTLYVADPNLPGDTTRTFTFNQTTGFSTYLSGDNANDLSIEYNTFLFSGLSALVDFRLLSQEFDRMIEGTIGEYRMPTFSLDFMQTYSVESADIVWVDVETPFTVRPDFNQTVPTDLENKLVISGTTGIQEAVYTIYQDGEIVYGGITPTETEGYFVYQLPLEQGTHSYGVLASIEVEGITYYIDYVEFTYTYQGN